MTNGSLTEQRLVDVILATDTPNANAAARHCVATAPICWERGGSFMPTDIEVVWEAHHNFYDYFKTMESSAKDDDASLPGLDPRKALEVDVLPEFSFTTAMHFDSSPGPTITRYTIRSRILNPWFFAEYRVGPARIAEEFNKMCKDRGKPDSRILIGVTDMDLDSASAEPVSGGGVDQLLNPTTVPQLVESLEDRDADPQGITLAISGFERLFADFFVLSQEMADGRYASLPWESFDSAFAAARDPDFMRQLLQLVIARRPHLRTLMNNASGFGALARTLVVAPIMPCGFLSSYARPVNFDPLYDRWLLGDPASMAMRGEGHEPDVVPYGTCDIFLTAVLGERARTPVQIGSDDIRAWRARAV